MKRKTAAIRRATASLPPAPVPAGIEIVDTSVAITILLRTDARCIVAEGTPVAKGTPLSDCPDPGSFASVYGTVRRIMPWDGGARGRFTAIIIDRSPDDGTPHRHFDPVSDPWSLAPDELREKARAAGFRLPEPPTPVLFSALDEDTDHVTNRWSLEKEFGRVVEGLRLLRHLCNECPTIIALPDSLPEEQRRQCGRFGTVVDVRSRYPQSTIREIVRRHQSHFPGSGVVAIDCKRLLSLVTTLRSGVAPTTMRISLRIGRRGQTRLFEIPIGMGVGDLLSVVNHTISDGTMIIIGGEMTGSAADSQSQPLAAGCESVLVLPRSEAAMHENTPCVNCGRCVHTCPEGLRVDLICKNVEFSREKEAVRLGIHQCIDCGLCTAACIVRRPLGYLLAFGKSVFVQTSAQKGAA